ncbi:PREDICTED: matrilysin-like, partial [Priapulus caudatus]|uniref:Matrilysin-like n=1 Tax=Priapulus caudatus TaxID=37621 RepID=A0ABM1DVN3_PRICU
CDLTWALATVQQGLANFYVRAVLGEAIDKWAKAVNYNRPGPTLIFNEDSDSFSFDKPDLQFGFNYGNHGDVLPFDGPGPSVAHSFYPYISGIFNGHVHFDEYEDWTKRSNVGKLFPLIALHELGHALGLPHTNDNRAVMYPVLDRRSIKTHDLQPQDVGAIQNLYHYRLCEGNGDGGRGGRGERPNYGNNRDGGFDDRGFNGVNYNDGPGFNSNFGGGFGSGGYGGGPFGGNGFGGGFQIFGGFPAFGRGSPLGGGVHGARQPIGYSGPNFGKKKK